MLARFRSFLTHRIEQNLRVRGVRWDDLRPQDEDLQRALKFVPPEEYQGRIRRLFRHQDNDLKRADLPIEAQNASEPLRDYVYPLIVDLRNRRIERESYE